MRRAHELGLAVIMDLVHAHYVKNLNEGINELDGTDHLYSPPGEAGDQPYWDSKLFDYGKGEVQHFLLSNVKYWLDEFHFDGFRFDGVTSMLYRHHGYIDFDCRDRYFDEGVNEDAVDYLTLANRLVHDFRPAAVTIAEDVSGMPGMCIPIDDGGIGFDYRLGMAIPDYWIKQLKEVPDEEWNIWEMWSVMTNRLPGVKTVAYAESHDQALVGDKTLAFRLMDKEMYDRMDRASESLVIDRGMALHKMIRLMTIAAGGDAYLNFMGNEFGHPEWIDFPREGNGWSYAHARRQWSLSRNGFLRYSWLGDFDRAMIRLVKKIPGAGRRLPLQPAHGRAEQDDGLLARPAAVRLQLAPLGVDPRLRTDPSGPRANTFRCSRPTNGGSAVRSGSRCRSSTSPSRCGATTDRTTPRIRIYNTSRTATVTCGGGSPGRIHGSERFAGRRALRVPTVPAAHDRKAQERIGKKSGQNAFRSGDPALSLPDNRKDDGQREKYGRNERRSGDNGRGNARKDIFRRCRQDRRECGRGRSSKSFFARLARSEFRSRFRLGPAEAAYAERKGAETLRRHAENFVRTRLAPAVIPQRRPADAHAGTPRVHRPARHGLLLPQMSREMASHPGGPGTERRGAAVRRRGADGLDRTAAAPASRDEPPRPIARCRTICLNGRSYTWTWTPSTPPSSSATTPPCGDVRSPWDTTVRGAWSPRPATRRAPSACIRPSPPSRRGGSVRN